MDSKVNSSIQSLAPEGTPLTVRADSQTSNSALEKGKEATCWFVHLYGCYRIRRSKDGGASTKKLHVDHEKVT